MNKKYPVALLGATGLVGQKVVALLENHPRFFLEEVVASKGKSGGKYVEAVQWREPLNLSERVANLRLKNSEDLESRLVISALPSNVALEVESKLIEKGCYVSSNASSYRMDKDVPILIPEINLSHMALVNRQKGPGRMVSNSNCTTAFVALALKPLMSLGKIVHVSVVTMQAISGAGSKGIDTMEIFGNIIPHIEGEEKKIVQETKKILGDMDSAADFDMMVHVHRVPVLHGHTVVLHVQFDQELSCEEVYQAYKSDIYHLYTAQDRPQPVLDIGPYDHDVHIGRIKMENKRTVGLIAMGNNLVRGAAGAAIQNLEVLLNHG